MGDYPENIDIDIEDLPESQRELAEQLGVDGYQRLINYTGGCSVYVSQGGRIAKKRRNKMIKSDYNAGIPLRAIARKYNLSEMRIRQILKM